MSSLVILDTIYLTRGDTFRAQISMYQDEEQYIPQEGDIVRFALKNAADEVIITKTISNDSLLLELEPADTKGLEVGTYVYDVEITFADGTVDTFIADAVLKLTSEVI